jgi:hypothetical protein
MKKYLWWISNVIFLWAARRMSDLEMTWEQTKPWMRITNRMCIFQRDLYPNDKDKDGVYRYSNPFMPR